MCIYYPPLISDFSLNIKIYIKLCACASAALPILMDKGEHWW